VQIGEDGQVTVEGRPVGQIRLVEFDDPHVLSRAGNNLYSAPDEARSTEAAGTSIAPASLEMSNVQIPYEMAQMTLGLRAYAANQRVINAIDETMTRLINEVASPV
jgi:flagellar basal-body rod protein FlgG